MYSTLSNVMGYTLILAISLLKWWMHWYCYEQFIVFSRQRDKTTDILITTYFSFDQVSDVKSAVINFKCEGDSHLDYI